MKFVYAVVWLTHEIFPNFSIELLPLIGDKISFFLNIFINNEWILINCVYALKYMFHAVTKTHYFLELFNRVILLNDLELCLCSISCEIICGFDQIL